LTLEVAYERSLGQKDKASGRKEAVTKLVESLEGKLEAAYFALGEHHVVIIADLSGRMTDRTPAAPS
jgi:uncharacterized protein with GYD domain